jgi:uncharacterized protein (TIGR02145 family)
MEMLKNLMVFALMVFGLVFTGSPVFAQADQDMRYDNSSDTCLTIMTDHGMFVPCANYNGVGYEFMLFYFADPFDPQKLFWQMDLNSFKLSSGGSCIDVNSDLGMTIPCASYMGTRYGFKLDFYNNPSDPNGLYWLMNWESLTNEEVKIGNQIWMKKNLETDHYRNGDLIPQITDPTEWNQTATGAWCYYNNDPVTGAVYGKLYNWHAVNDPRGLAPTGWHVAFQNEWEVLFDYLGGDTLAGGKLKEAGTTHWTAPNTGATNVTGFTALPGGARSYNGSFANLGLWGTWWTATDGDEFSAKYVGMFNDDKAAAVSADRKAKGFSIRCIKD